MKNVISDKCGMGKKKVKRPIGHFLKSYLANPYDTKNLYNSVQLFPANSKKVYECILSSIGSSTNNVQFGSKLF